METRDLRVAQRERDSVSTSEQSAATDGAIALLDAVAHVRLHAGRIVGASPAVKRETGIDPDRLVGRAWAEFIGAYDDTWIDLITAGKSLDIELSDPFDGLLLRARLLGEFNEAAYLELRALEPIHLAHDELTGLPKRAAVLTHLRQHLLDAEVGAETAVLFLDVDNFKAVNDRLGYDAGDELLVEVANRLRSAVRGLDLVGRYGGDEFVVVTPDAADEEAIRTAALRVFEAVSGSMSCAGVKVPVSVSIGVVSSSPTDRSADSLLNKADLAMYEAKRNGRSRLEYYSDGMTARASERSKNQALLVDAVKNGEMRIHFQRVVPARAGAGLATGAEALARWQHPTKGLVGPDAFIGVAEETGYITTLGTELIRLAIVDFVAWPGDDRPDFLAVVADSGLDPTDLVVELTEGAFAKGKPVLDNLRRFRERGVRIHLDDFGTGYSSLSYLRRFPVDGIKIDRSFLHPTIDEGLIRIIVDIASTMGIVTVAEGIETHASLQKVTELGVTYAQGFLIDRPAPAGNLDVWEPEAHPSA